MSHSGNTNDETLYNESHSGNTTRTVGTVLDRYTKCDFTHQEITALKMNRSECHAIPGPRHGKCRHGFLDILGSDETEVAISI